MRWSIMVCLFLLIVPTFGLAMTDNEQKVIIREAVDSSMEKNRQELELTLLAKVDEAQDTIFNVKNQFISDFSMVMKTNSIRIGLIIAGCITLGAIAGGYIIHRTINNSMGKNFYNNDVNPVPFIPPPEPITPQDRFNNKIKESNKQLYEERVKMEEYVKKEGEKAVNKFKLNDFEKSIPNNSEIKKTEITKSKNEIINISPLIKSVEKIDVIEDKKDISISSNIKNSNKKDFNDFQKSGSDDFFNRIKGIKKNLIKDFDDMTPKERKKAEKMFDKLDNMVHKNR